MHNSISLAAMRGQLVHYKSQDQGTTDDLKAMIVRKVCSKISGRQVIDLYIHFTQL